ncbi:triokinase/FMN cyclase-like [Amphibalanus amphitrite]|uniref:triokinase/FMN cyclase-like n=1 Tax=Amphibalanus amphitrite TaxID=1232801 RepID=UPI001C9234B0|nr:triokinase/FMN cyclase-like [Amphibalanus amphitrite]
MVHSKYCAAGFKGPPVAAVMPSQLLNEPEQAPDEALAGLLSAEPSLARLQGHRVVVRRGLEQWRSLGQPALVAVAAAAHGPWPAGLVGAGLLTAAALGDLETPPAADTVTAAVRAAATAGGVLLVAMDLPADRQRCGLAAERARAAGVTVQLLLVADDCGAAETRRGHAGIVLLCKVLGEAAQTPGRSLQDLVAIARQVTDGLGTVALGLPSASESAGGGDADPATMELGVGVRGEPGARTVPACTSAEAVKLMYDHLTRADAPTPFSLPAECVLLVNSLGGLSEIELLVAARDAQRQLTDRGVRVARLLTGSLCSWRARRAVSVTVLSLADGHVPGQLLLHWLGQPAAAPGWPDAMPPGAYSEPQLMEPAAPPPEDTSAGPAAGEPLLSDRDALLVTRCVERASQALVAAAGRLDELDRGAGDGDCGSTLASLGRLLLERLPTLAAGRPRRLLTQLADSCETIGGTSGVLYALAMAAAAAGWSSEEQQPWLAALGRGLDAVRRYGGAQLGDRTLLDAAEPALRAAEEAAAAGQPPAVVAAALAAAAEQGALRTAGMAARAGRASYVSSDQLTRPDPGAQAVSVWLAAVAGAIREDRV